MNTKEENSSLVRVKKVRKNTRPKKSTKTDALESTSTDFTDRISIKRRSRVKAEKKQNKKPKLNSEPIPLEEIPCVYPTQPDLLAHKKTVRTFIRTICIAGFFAFILSDYYLVLQELHQAKIQINELTQITNTATTTSSSDELNVTQSILQDIGQRIELPIGEDPTVVLIEDAEKASKEQVFYSQVIEGDIVVIYPNAKKAIIWSPSRMKIVNAGAVYIQSNQSQNSSETASTTKKKDIQ